ncbi:unnamed protein product [Diamesa hyperborea]
MNHSVSLRNNDTTFADFTQLRVQHYNRTERVWTGNMTFFVDVGNDYEIETMLYKNSGNQYKKTPYKEARAAFCDSVQKKGHFDVLRESSNIPAKEICPWPKGTYQFSFSFEILLVYSGVLNEEDTTFADFTQMKVARVNRSERLWVGSMTFFVDVGNEIEVETRLYKSTGNQYQQTPFKRPRSTFCDYVRDNENFDDMRQVSNLPVKGVCPWPKGTYEIYGYNINVNRMQPYFEGDYMVETAFYENDKQLNGYQLFVTVIQS